MINGITEQWLRQQVQDIESAAADISPYFLPADIHRFRVKSKQLRAVLRFLQNDQAFNLPAKFKKRYRQAGSIREYQRLLQKLTIPNEQPMPTFAVWTAYRMADASKGWSGSKVEAGIAALKRSMERCRELDIQEANLWKYYRSYMRWLENATGADAPEIGLRKIRRRTKDMLYILALCRQAIPEAQDEIALAERRLLSLVDIAGRYNDNISHIEALQRFKKDCGSGLDAEETNILNQVAQDWMAEHSSLKQSLVDTAKELNAQQAQKVESSKQEGQTQKAHAS